eukprot:CAMPEP_0198132094 /NCGR_PEP_ID=MMETSP1442-20131203/57572_1 /TAXON_ID= /ORGANISM="Craspedostauros australis, Strain CCMP3328" /LENGTH=521 /DNA_ID=CAMNT_0043793029 /DNA_START=23 /DNA_END=1588 /DNA_ORIENTATION=-
MDTCQQLRVDGDDASSFIPKLKVFDGLLPDFGNNLPSLDDLFQPNFDWGAIDWANKTWGDVFDIDMDEISTCSVVKKLVEITDAFDVDGECKCDGNFRDGIVLNCGFNTICEEIDNDPDGTICASSEFAFAISNLDDIDVSVALDFPNDDIDKFQFTYSIPLGDDSDEQTCTAKIGEEDCTCQIENWCWTVDCPIEGGRFDTCQFLSLDNQYGPTSFFPKFDRFDPNFEIDWGNYFDSPSFVWDDFNFTQWFDANFGDSQAINTWNDLLDDLELPDFSICPLLKRSIEMGSEFGDRGSCECSGTPPDELKISCHFDNECIDADTCGSITIDFPFAGINAVEAKVCVDEPSTVGGGTDIEVKTTTRIAGSMCYEYSISIADRNANGCKATYDNQPCECEIDDAHCIKVDCNSVQAGAYMDTCQHLELEDADDAKLFVPRLNIAVEDMTGSDPGSSITAAPTTGAPTSAPGGNDNQKKDDTEDTTKDENRAKDKSSAAGLFIVWPAGAVGAVAVLASIGLATV